MINAIIFDFGDVFINLDKEASVKAFKELGMVAPSQELIDANDLFEKGKISEEEFLAAFKTAIPNAAIKEIKAAWNTIIGEFPLYRLEFLQMLSQKYRLFLLTNTDRIHIKNFEKKVGISFFSDFYQCFEKVYYSFEMGMRKPEPEIFTRILNNHGLSAKRTLFIDDKKQNVDAAEALGIQVWHLQVGEEDVIDLFNKNFIFS